MITLAPPFRDHAVLQRDQALPIWGWASPHAQIEVRLGPHEGRVCSADDGGFMVTLPPLPAGGPHELSVTDHANGSRVEVRDLLIGEVWIASGQSNMQKRVSECGDHAAEALDDADYPEIRFFTVENRAHIGRHRLVGGSWEKSSRKSAGGFSAVAFHFARRIHSELGVPVGILSASWGGTFIQAWMSRNALMAHEPTRGWCADYEITAREIERWKRAEEANVHGRVPAIPADPGNRAFDQGWAAPDFDDSSWPLMPVPSRWQSHGHEGSGVFWFRKHFDIPESWRGRELVLNLGEIDKQDITYANGVEIGRTGKDFEDEYWNTPRVYRIPAELNHGSLLVIAVRVYSFLYHGGLGGPAETMALHPADEPRAVLPLAGDWSYAIEHDFGVVTEAWLMGHGEPNSPHMLFDNMITPLIPYAIRGALWYQGEANLRIGSAYQGMLEALVRDWRWHWAQGDFPFLVVQLPRHRPPQAYQPDSEWALVREAQIGAGRLPGVGVAITIDTGDAMDIHPQRKAPVADRLARLALAGTYGREMVASGPVMRECVREGDSLRCHFDHCGGGLCTSNGGPPQTFFLSGADQRYLPAQVRIEGDTVVANHPDIPEPQDLCYAWADNPEGCNLTNDNDLPASPFRWMARPATGCAK
jgi:sialate O-acetylesterase